MAGISAIYVSATQFTVTTDRTSEFSAGRRIKADCGVDSYKYGTIESVAYTTVTTVTLTAASDDLTSNLAQVWYGITKRGASGSLANHGHSDEVTGGLINDLILSGGNIGIIADPDLIQLTSDQVVINGNVGIGTDSPTALLELSSPSPSLYLMETDGDANKNWGMWVTNGDLYFGEINDAGEALNVRVAFQDGGNVGIGTNSPRGTLDISSPVPVLYFEDNNQGANEGLWKMVGSGQGKLTFVTRNDADTTGETWMEVQRENDSHVVDHVSFPSGNIGIGTSTFGTNAAKVLALFAGTAPTTSPADIVQLWVEDVGGAGQAELRARDELGNVTTLSPHNFELFEPDSTHEYPWSYRAESPYIGKKINVDMYGAIKAIEQLMGKQFIFTEDIPKVNPSDEKKEYWKERWIEKNTVEVEIDKSEAFETVDIEEDDKKNAISEKVTYKLEDAEVIEVKMPIYAKKLVRKTRLKEDIRFDEDTGKFLKKRVPTDLNAEAAAVTNFHLEMPDWLKNRMI